MEVRFHMLRPDQIRERREACPVVYIPLGTLEWHGLHAPMGADGLQADYLSLGCARQGGGVVFPTVYYGESRVGSLLETDIKYKEGIADRLGIDPILLTEERHPYRGYQQIEHYQHHLVHILAEAASYGYQLAVFVVGHYPLLDHARAAILSYNQWCYDKLWSKMGVWAFTDHLLLREIFQNPGDHAGVWETSHLLCSDPQTVDMELAKEEYQYGIFASTGPEKASIDFGKEIYDAAIAEVIKKVETRLKSPDKYNGHCMPLD